MSTFKGTLTLDDSPAGGTVLNAPPTDFSAKVTAFSAAPESNVRERSATIGNNLRNNALGSDAVPVSITFRLENSDIITFTALHQQRLPVTVVATPLSAPAAPDVANPRTTVVILWPKAPSMQGDPDQDIEYTVEALAASYLLEDGTNPNVTYP